MKAQFEVHDRHSPLISEVKNFWLREWDKVFRKLIGKEVQDHQFHEYDYHYVLRFNGKIGGIMSSAWQNIHQDFTQDPYYSSLDQVCNLLKSENYKKFHKMGMIAADLSKVPEDFKLTRIIIGCGMKYAQDYLPGCDGVVSFPRPDTSVYKACVEWGARPLKEGLTMHNVPVNFIILKHSELKKQHADPYINAATQELWKEKTLFTNYSLSA